MSPARRTDSAGGSSQADDAAPAAPSSPPPGPGHRITCHLDELLQARGMTLVELAERAGVTTVNLSVLKNNRARAIRFSTLTAVCESLECEVGELLTVDAAPDANRQTSG